ncbi:MAG: DUF3575 domain-containing protein [Balneolaceae bacterium]
MKKTTLYTFKGLFTLSVLLLSLSLAGVTQAQEITVNKQNTIKTNLSNLILSGGSIHYERVLGESTSAQLGVFASFISVDDTNFNGFGIIPQYRFYPRSNNGIQEGFFLAPLVGYQTFSLETSMGNNEDAKATYSLLGAGLDIGNKWLIGQVLSLEISAGVSFNSTSLEIETSNASEDDFSIGGFGSTTPRLGLSVGYVF